MSEPGPSETTVHFAAVLLAFGALAATSSVVEAFELSRAAGTAGAVVFNAIVFGGAHLYLAVRGDDGTVPVAARWRFLAALGVVAVAALAAIAFGDVVEAAVGIGVESVGFAFVLVVGLAYLLLEARSGYTDTMSASD